MSNRTSEWNLFSLLSGHRSPASLFRLRRPSFPAHSQNQHHEYHPGQTGQWVSAQRRHGPQLHTRHAHVQPPAACHQLHEAHLPVGHGRAPPGDDPEERARLAPGPPGRHHQHGRLPSQHGHQAGEAKRAGLPHAHVRNRRRSRDELSRRGRGEERRRHAGHVLQQPPSQ